MLASIKNITQLLSISLFIATIGNSEICFAKKVKIAFHINFLSLRGTEVAVYDYADFNETILGNESIILNNMEIFSNPQSGFHTDSSNSAREKFEKRFPGRFFDYANMQEADEILKREHVDIFYVLKAGEKDDRISKVCKNAVHAVFTPQVHGDVYACISQWLSSRYASLHIPYVPHIVRLDDTKETLRDELHIPADAVVFGRHGGFGTFDLWWAREAVVQIAEERKDWYFVFLNTRRFCNLPNVIFLPGTADMLYKTKFINTCDAMIHARHQGETFGLSCAEFSIQNKPVITWNGSGETAHIALLGSKGFYYSNKQELLDVLRFCANKINEIRTSNWDCYSKDYNPATVMKKFNEVFIQPLISADAKR